MRTIAHHFQPHDLLSGHLALDLVNTVTARDAEPWDWLQDFDALLQWAGLSGQFAARDLGRLAQLAQARPAAAGAALARCRRLREALHAGFAALHQGKPMAAGDLQALERLRQASSRRMALVASRQGITLQPTVEGSGLDLIADTVLGAALPLLAAPPLERLRVCDGSHCGWLFLDSSKAGRRRWCDMATCGAAYKAQRFRSRAAAIDNPQQEDNHE